MGWVQVATPKVSPSARGGHAVAALPDGASLLVVGGATREPRVCGDVWMLQRQRGAGRFSWTALATTPPASGGPPPATPTSGAPPPDSPASGGPPPVTPASGNLPPVTLTSGGPPPGTQAPPPAAVARRTGCTASALGRRVFVIGGMDPSAERLFNDVAVLDLDTLKWSWPSIGGTPPPPLHSHTATCVGGTKILVFGGASVSGCLDGTYILDTEELVWRAPAISGKGPCAREMHAACAVAGQRVLVCGGRAGGGRVLEDMYILRTEPMEWECKGAMGVSLCAHSAVGDPSGKKVFVYGGFTGEDVEGSMWSIDTENLKVCTVSDAAMAAQAHKLHGAANPPPRFAHVASLLHSAAVARHQERLVQERSRVPSPRVGQAQSQEEERPIEQRMGDASIEDGPDFSSVHVEESRRSDVSVEQCTSSARSEEDGDCKPCPKESKEEEGLIEQRAIGYSAQQKRAPDAGLEDEAPSTIGSSLDTKRVQGWSIVIFGGVNPLEDLSDVAVWEETTATQERIVVRESDGACGLVYLEEIG